MKFAIRKAKVRSMFLYHLSKVSLDGSHPELEQLCKQELIPSHRIGIGEIIVPIKLDLTEV
ncbi:hypothetical protein SDC9_109876 [bioreactor metagenome]|uniref:Uncharacterized protein n=1 Tax=bioreactor metagenome TaxID=1076179 RepID=A0A645BD69_9ZZZZ